MTEPANDKLFAGAIPDIYERLLVPLMFEPFAAELAGRLKGMSCGELLELAAGTGVLTRRLAATLPAGVSITATDLNPPMLEMAQKRGTSRQVTWQVADAMALPFRDASFDAVLCQFGVMFLPDKPRAFAEMRRVLRPGGLLLFNVWDGVADNEFAQVTGEALDVLLAPDPPRFLERIPHGYHDPVQIARDLKAGGFASRPQVDTVTARSRADSAKIAAVAFCQGTPLRNEILARDPQGLLPATEALARALRRRFGPAAIEGRIQAKVVSIRR